MTAINRHYGEHLSAMLATRMGSSELGKKVEIVFGVTIFFDCDPIKVSSSFLESDQSKLDPHNASHDNYLDNSKEERRIKPLYPKLGEAIGTFFDRSKPVMELGAGLPNEKGETKGMAMLGPKFTVIPSDFNPHIVKAGKKTNQSYRDVDARRLEKSEVKQFVAYNMLDTMKDQEIASLLDNLPAGAVFAHINDIQPMINRFAWELLSKEDDLVFPYFDNVDAMEGAYVIPNYRSLRSRLIRELDEMELNFLDVVFRMSIAKKESLFIVILSTDAYALSLWIEKAIPKECLKTVNLRDHYEDRLKALSAPNIEKLFCGRIKASEITDKVQTRGFSDRNRIWLDRGTLYMEKLYVLAPDKEMVEARLTTLVIKKIRPPS